MFNQKKRSRFAKSSAEIPVQEENSEFADDYMAPVEQLLGATRNVTTSPQFNEADTDNKKQKPSLQSLMDESRQNAMAIPISSSNVGFKLLQKFGYNEGEGLGKNNSGLVEPIAIHKRKNADVSGLGVAEKKERMQRTLLSLKTSKNNFHEKLQADFVSDRANRQAALISLGDMKRAQKIIYALDEKADIAVHELTASLDARYSSAVGASNREFPPLPTGHTVRYDNTLVVTSAYDRYSSTHVLDTALEDDDHRHDDQHTDHITPLLLSADTPTSENSQRTILDPTLADCLHYLREVHFYCYYCGTGYEDEEDLLLNCPGCTEDDH